MVNLFRDIINLSLIGSIAFLLFLSIEQITKRVFGASWHYRVLKFIMLLFVIPVGKIGELLVTGVIKENNFQDSFLNNNDIMFYAKLTSDSVFKYDFIYNTIIVTWITGIIIFILRQFFCYLRFRYIIASNKKYASRRVHEIADRCAKKFNITKPIKIYVNENMNTPMLIGFFSPIILLPNDNIELSNVEHILSHELTHYKNKDLLIKFGMLLLRSLHWFNPLCYVLSGKLDKWCEYTCDEKNAIDLTNEKKKKYGLAILEAAAIMPVYSSNFGTPFLLPKQNLKERLMFMINVKRTKKKTILFSLAIALIFINVSLTVASTIELMNGSRLKNYYNGDEVSIITYDSTVTTDKSSDATLDVMKKTIQ